MESDRQGTARARWKAVLLSLVLPGLGEVYAGRPRAALLTFVLFYFLVAIEIVLVFLPVLPAGPFVLVIVSWGIVVVRAARAAAHAPQPFPLQPYNRWFWYSAAIAVSLLVWQPAVFNFIRGNWVQAFQIPSNAMAPTMLPGDFIFVSKRAPDQPRREEIIVFDYPLRPGLTYIKRIVGVAGDTLAMRNGILERNGTQVAEAFAQLTDPIGAEREHLAEGLRWHLAHLVAGDRGSYHPDMRNWGPIVVPPDSVFVLGDNRDNSSDSRFWGALGTDRIIGRPLVVYFSRQTGLGSTIRWSRIGHRF